MRKILFFSLATALLILVGKLGLVDRREPDVEPVPPKHEQGAAPVNQSKPPAPQGRTISRQVSPPLLPGRAPAQAVQQVKDYRRFVVKHPTITLSTGDWVAQNLGVLPHSEYSPRMGKLISKNSSFTFFEKDHDGDAWPVAYDPTTGDLNPISHILHLRGVSEEQRQELKSGGFDEYNYNQRLKLFSLKSTASDVLAVYQELLSKGFRVQLEVLKQVPVSR